MAIPLRAQLLATIRRHRMLTPGDRLGVGVSGGADSTALLLLLQELRADLGVTLLVLHFHHQLRGAEADADQAFVAGLAGRRGLEFVPGTADVAAESRRQGENLEATARRLRYSFFNSVVAAGRAARIAVGHTADDQAETVLAHILRGTGPTGLAAIHPVAGHLIRPLLSIRRSALRNYLSARGQDWREDITNQDREHLRSRLRHTLLPQLEQEFQPAIVERLCSLAALAHSDEQFWAALTEDRFAAFVKQTPAGLEISIADVLSRLTLANGEPRTAGPPPAFEALSRRLVRRILQELRGDRYGFTSVHIEQVLRLATESTSGHRVPLPADITVERSFDHLLFTRPDGIGARAPVSASSAEAGTAASDSSYEYQVAWPAAAGSAEMTFRARDRRLHLKVIDWPAPPSETRESAAAVDSTRLRAPLVLRNWRPGDAYPPCGHRQAQKLKRMFQQRRVTARERAVWPVLTSAGELVWAAGLPVAAQFAAGPATRAVLLIAEEKL